MQTGQQHKKRAPLKLGSHEIPFDLETRHIFMQGTTGAGKTQAIFQLLETIRANRDPAFLIDLGSEALKRLYRPGIDHNFNPLDCRCPGWTISNELRKRGDFKRVAKLFIPDLPGGANNSDWQRKTQRFAADVLQGTFNLGKRSGLHRDQWKAFRTNAMLLYYFRDAPLHGIDDVTSLEYLLQGTFSAALFVDKEGKSLGIVRDIVADYAEFLEYLEDGDFCVRDYVAGWTNPENDSWLFLPYTVMNADFMGTLISMIAALVIQYSLDPNVFPEDSHARHFSILDEIGSLPKISSLLNSLTTARKYGGVNVIGAQTFAQIRGTYGADDAQTILSCLGNQLILRVSDDETADKCSATLGDREVKEPNKGVSTSTTSGGGSGGSGQGASSNTNWSTSTNETKNWSRVVKKLVLPAEFMDLPDLTGFARIAGASGAQTYEEKYAEMARTEKKPGDEPRTWRQERLSLLTKVPICTLPKINIAEIPKSEFDLDV